VHRWGKTKGKIGFHGGKLEIERPRVRARSGVEVALPSWEAALAEDWLGQWAMNLMLINVSTRKFGRAVRLPGGDVPAAKGDGRSKSAVSRRFVALSAEHMAQWRDAAMPRWPCAGPERHAGSRQALQAAEGLQAAAGPRRRPEGPSRQACSA
jgi:hypothetical protein